MEAYFLTDVGKVRSQNEDSGGVFYNEDGQLLAIVADGLGGHSGGEVASQLAVDYMQKKWEAQTAIDHANELEKWLQDHILEANELIFKESKEKENLEGMGTTVVLAICTEEFITIAHIGDSRCYYYNNGDFRQLTEDHSLVNELLRAGQISQDDADYHPRKNVLARALGTEQAVECEIQTIVWEKGNKLLLCSDGLTNKLDDDELKEFLEQDGHVKEIGEKMIQLANDRGGEDNISLAIIEYIGAARVGEDR